MDAEARYRHVRTCVVDEQINLVAELAQRLGEQLDRNGRATLLIERLRRNQQDPHGSFGLRSTRRITGEPASAVNPTARETASAARNGALPLPTRCTTIGRKNCFFWRA